MHGLRVAGTRFFWRLYASYSAVLLATAVIVYFLVARNLSDSLVASQETSLQNATALLVPRVQARFPQGFAPELQAELEGLKTTTGYRITLIAGDGTVVADSDEDPARMNDHSTRPEILQAQEAPYGVAERFSYTVRYEMLYVAQRVLDREGGHGFVRVAVPLTEVEERLGRARNAVLLGTGVGLLVALGLGVLVARRITAPIAEMRQVADQLRRGNYQARIRDVPEDEVGVLADTLNLLTAELAERIARMTGEDARLRAMLAGMVEGVVAVDASDRIAFINRAALGLLNIGPGDLEGRGLWEVVRVAGLDELLAGARASGSVERRELFGEGPDKAGERVIEAHASPFAGPEGDRDAQGLVIVLHDVSDLRRLERVRRDFVANVSHELKTPLTSIKGFVETLLDGAVDDQEHNRRFLRRIDDNVERLSHLVTDLLSLARIESQAETLQRIPVDWREVVEAVIERARGPAERKGVQLAFEDPGGPLRVMGDAEGLTQVANNLIENAINYTPAPGEVRVRLSRSEHVARLVVADTGVGVPAEDLERIFERFYRVDKARSREMGGTGLGLSIVRNLVNEMEGRVRVSSELGEGSIFTVEIPLAP